MLPTALYLLTLSALAPQSKIEPQCSNLQWVSRHEWCGRPAKLVEHFTGPAPYVIIHHSYIPGACYCKEQCIKAMLSMQTNHQEIRKWNDIGYSFAIGGDNRVYIGRDFNTIAAHAPGYNNRSVGICLIGDWRNSLPPKQMLKVTNDLIVYGINMGYIQANYTLYGHRQVRNGTECPGNSLFSEISNWPHFRRTEQMQRQGD